MRSDVSRAMSSADMPPVIHAHNAPPALRERRCILLDQRGEGDAA